MDQLEKIFAEEKTVLFGEETIKIKTFRVKDVSTIAKIMSKLFAGLGSGKEINQSTLVNLLMSALSENAEDVMKLVASSTSLPVKKIEDLNLASMTFLVKHIVEQNIEFFQLQMLPQIKDLMKSVEEAAQETKTSGAE